MFRSPLAATLAVIAALAAGCGPRSAPRRPAPPTAAVDVAGPVAAARSLLAHVPADSPLVFASLAPLPAEFVDAEYLAAPGAYRDLVDRLDDLARDHADDYAGLDATVRILHRLLASVGGPLDRAGLAAIGLDPTARFVLYLRHGALVARAELGDAALTAAWLARSDGDALAVARLGERAYHHAELGDGRRLILAVSDGDLVVALVDADADDDALAVALGADAPAASLADDPRLADLAAHHHLLPAAVGYLDPAALAADRPSGPTDGAGPAQTLDCARDAAELLARVPRIAFGARALAADQVELAVAVELVASDRAALAEVVHPAARDTDSDAPPVELAVGVDLGAAMALSASALDRLGARSLRCPALLDGRDAGAQAAVDLRALAGTSLARITGLHLVIDSARFDGDRLRQASGRARIASDAAGDLAAMLLGGPGRAPGATGAATTVPLPAALAYLAPASVVVGADALTVGLGGSPADLATVAGAADDPFLRFELGDRFLDLLDTAPAEAYPGLAAVDPDAAAALLAVTARTWRRPLRLSLAAQLSADGVELRVTTRYRRGQPAR